MKYTVLWTPSAEKLLGSIWLTSLDRAGVTAAAHSIDKLLCEAPDRKGVEYFDTVRTLFISPLGVDFEVVEADRKVIVLTVWESLSHSLGTD